MLVESFSGIRGVYDEDIDLDVVKRYISAFVKFLKLKNEKPTVVVGMDTRPSSAEIKSVMVAEFLCGECDVIDVGVNPTPAIELGVREYKADAGVIITASHNEPEWNGWKFLDEKGSILEPKDIDLVISNFREGVSLGKCGKGKVDDKSKELVDVYADYVVDSLGEGAKLLKGMKIVADPNGGAAAVVLKKIFDKLGVEVVEKNMKLGEFKRRVEPNKKNLAYLSSLVKKKKADLGAGWDCDGDRVEMIDDKGEMISGQYSLAFMLEEVLSNLDGEENKIVVTNDVTSGVVKEVCAKYGAKVEEVEVGEINVVKKMYDLRAVAGGEGSSSGGILPPTRCRDGMQTLVFVMRLVARTGKKLSELYEEFPKYYTPRKNLEADDVDIVKVKKKIEEMFVDEGYNVKKTGDETGGLKIVIDDTSWIWYRESKTESGVFRVIVDSKSEEKSEELLKKGEEAFNEAVRTI